MADFSISVAEDQFICPICLDLLKEPVTVPCGHSYCMSCITGHWNQEDQRRTYSCPQCRKTFMPRPVLGKNVMIAEMVEKVKKTEPRDAVPAGPGDVKCDVCTGRKNKAFKSCLVCLNSYCQTHFEEFHSDKQHKVIDATGRLKQMICQKHDKILEVFCLTDQLFICVLCVMDEHRNHETVSAAEEKSKMQGHLRKMQRTYQQKIQKKEMKLQELRETVESHKRSAQAAVEDSEKIFSDLIRSIERSRSEVTQLIRAQERASVSRAEERPERLKQEIMDLRTNKTELEQLSDTDDHVHLLQVTELDLGHDIHSYYELCCYIEKKDLCSIGRGGRYGKNIISQFFSGRSRFTILSRFFVMLVLLFCKLSEHYSQTNFPILKRKPYKVTKYKRMADI
uniref:Uncharacterized protein n=1 Tax=Sinocyclocheilus grahami TaxID=75366 RepID=A0A672P2K9_SINGR